MKTTLRNLLTLRVSRLWFALAGLLLASVLTAAELIVSDISLSADNITAVLTQPCAQSANQ